MEFIIATLHLSIDGEILAADGKLLGKKGWQATLGRVAAELDQLQGATMKNILQQHVIFTIHSDTSKDQLEP